MSLKICPKCGRNSVIKKPNARIMRESLGSMLHIANEYSLDCLKSDCNYTTGTIRVNTKLGDYFELSPLKRLFTKIPI